MNTHFTTSIRPVLIGHLFFFQFFFQPNAEIPHTKK